MFTMVGVKRIAFLMPESASLKDKRQIIRKLRDTITSKFNASFAEVDTDDKLQRSIVSIAMVANTDDVIRAAFVQISNMVEQTAGVRVFNDVDDIFRYEDESGSAWIPE